MLAVASEIMNTDHLLKSSRMRWANFVTRYIIIVYFYWVEHMVCWRCLQCLEHHQLKHYWAQVFSSVLQEMK